MEKEEKQVLSGQASDEQITIWKNTHKDVFEVIVRDKIGYLKRPDRNTLKAASDFAEGDGMKSNEILLENCWLGGDDEIKTNDLYFLALSPLLVDLVDYGRAEIKKL